MKEYTKQERQAICEALNAILDKANDDSRSWLSVCGPAIIFRSMRVEIAWDNDAEVFRPVK